MTEVAYGAEGRTTVTAIGPDGTLSRWFPRCVVDASGRDTLLASRLGFKRLDKRNNTAALYGHFHNLPRREGDAEGMITMHLFDHGWFWMIPLPDVIMSVGVSAIRLSSRPGRATSTASSLALSLQAPALRSGWPMPRRSGRWSRRQIIRRARGRSRETATF